MTVIKISFTTDNMDVAKDAHMDLTSSPNGTCTASQNSFQIATEYMRSIYNRHAKKSECLHPVMFYVDPDILNAHYSGLQCNIDGLKNIPGVSKCEHVSDLDYLTSDVICKSIDPASDTYDQRVVDHINNFFI